MTISRYTITFDKVHTAKKQQLLSAMMEKTCADVIALGNPTLVAKHCPICQSSKLGHFTKRYGFDLSICEQCAHIFCNPMPSKEQLHFYYNSEMKDFENEFFLQSFENRIPIFNNRIDIMQRYITNGRLLDIGSAIGIFIAALHRKHTGYELHCCDPSESACTLLKKSYTDITTHQCMVEDMEMLAQFDGITMWDTLEHIMHPVKVAQKIHTLLKDKGYWFFSTPNTDSLEWSVAAKDHVQLLPPGHINLFNEKSIGHLLALSGFELVASHTLNGSLDVSYVQKLLLNGNHAMLQNAGNLIARHIQDAHFAEQLATLLVNTKKAGNIFVIAQKKEC